MTEGMRSIAGAALGLLAALVCSLPSAPAWSASQDAIVGTWLTEAADSKVEISAAGGTCNGKVVWLKDPERAGKPAGDVNNTDAGLRERPIMGLEILSGFQYASGGWSGGTAHSLRRGKSFPAELAATKDGKLGIKVKDGFLFKQLYWTR